MLSLLLPAPPAVAPVRDPEEAARLTRIWQRRVLVSTVLGYAVYYFVRKNLSVAMPFMEREGLGKAQLGLFLTLHGLVYGLSKFGFGIVGDRANARRLLVVGLVGSVVMNVCFGLSSAILLMGLLWMVNGLFQGMGFPPCARLMTNWFPPRELATKFSLWRACRTTSPGGVHCV